MNANTLSLAACLILCTTLLRAELTSGSAPPITWGLATNDILAGVRVQRSFKHGGDAVCQTVIYVGTTNSSKQIRAYCPKPTELFLAELFDRRAEQVPRTKLGAKFGQDPPPIAHLKDKPGGGPGRWNICIATSDREEQVGHFNISEHFLTAEPGAYRLRIELRLYLQVPNGELVLFRLPTVTLAVPVP